MSEIHRNSPDLVLGSIAHRVEIEETQLILCRFGLVNFLLILPSLDLAESVYNGGRAFVTPAFHLHIMRWTRFLYSCTAFLLSAAEVEVRGIPTHAWDFHNCCRISQTNSIYLGMIFTNRRMRILSEFLEPKRRLETIEIQMEFFGSFPCTNLSFK